MNKFFSEKHPAIYNAAKLFIPAAPALSFMIVILYDMLSGATALKNILAAIVPRYDLALTDYQRWETLGYLDVTIINAALIFIAIIFFYVTVWRFLFPVYVIRYGSHNVRDGRLYWTNTNALTRLWDRFYKSPPRPTREYYINHGRLINPLRPENSLTRLTTTTAETFERSPFAIVVKERVGRYVIGDRHLTTTNDTIPNTAPDNDYVKEVFATRSADLVNATADLSYANPHIRLDMLADASYYEDRRIFEVIEDDKE